MIFFDDEKGDFNVANNSFLENTLFYINQGHISIHKDQIIVYNQYFIVGEVIELQNSPTSFDEYQLKENEVKIIVPFYNQETGDFKGKNHAEER